MSNNQIPPKAVITSNFDQFQVFALISWIEANNYDPFVHIETKFPGVRLPASEMAKSTAVINLAARACGKFRWHEDHIEVANRFGGQEFTCLIPYRAIALAVFRGTATATVMPWAIMLPDGKLTVALPTDEAQTTEGVYASMDPGVEGGDQSWGTLPAPVTEALKALDTSPVDVGRGLVTPNLHVDDPPPRMRGHLRVVK